MGGNVVGAGLRDELFKLGPKSIDGGLDGLDRVGVDLALLVFLERGLESPCCTPSRSGWNSSPSTACGHWPSMVIRSRQTVIPSEASSKGMLAITSGLSGVLICWSELSAFAGFRRTSSSGVQGVAVGDIPSGRVISQPVVDLGIVLLVLLRQRLLTLGVHVGPNPTAS